MLKIMLMGSLMLALTLASVNAQSERELPSFEVITVENVQEIEQIGMLSYGLIQDATYSPDGEIVTVAGSLGLIFYDANEFEHTSSERWILPEEMVFAVAYHPNGTIIATVSGERLSGSDKNKVFRLWDLNTQTPMAEWSAPYNYEQITFSPNGNELVVTSKFYYEERVVRWDVSNPVNVYHLPELPVSELQRQWAGVITDITLPEYAYALTYSLDGRYIAYANRDVYLLDAANGEILFTLKPDEFMGSAFLYFTPNSRILVSLAYSEMSDGVIEAWDTLTGEKVLHTRSGGVRAFGFHPLESELIFATSYESGMRRWRNGVDESEYILGQNIVWAENRYSKIAFNADGSILAAIHAGAIEFWDVWRGIKARDDLYLPFDDTYTTRNIYTQIAYSPDGSYFAAAGIGEIQLYDAETMFEVGRVSYDMAILDLEFNPDSTLLMSYHSDFQGEFPQDRVFLWDIEAVVNDNSAMLVAQIANFNNLAPLSSAIAFSPNGKRLAYSGVGVELWDVATILEAEEIGFDAKFPGDLLGHPALVGNPGSSNSGAPIAFSPDNKYIATGYYSGLECYAAVWEVQSEDLIACLGTDLPQDNPVQAFRFLSDTLLVTGAEQLYYDLETLSRSIRIWDITNSKLLVELEGHFEDYNDIAISPDGRLIVSSGGGYTCNLCPSYDGALRIWGVPPAE